MKICKTISETQDYVAKLRKSGKSIGFVPTMGALHAGHISLLKTASLNNDVVASSIFVNPIQFNKKEDLQKYPRTLEDDIRKLEEIECDLLFNPDVDEMYPEPVLDRYNFGNLDKVMEGRHRPGHFNGVAVVVRKLFEIVKPDRAYFGMKDYQQLKIIQAMVSKLGLPVQIIPCPTMREPDGLAMSSRNVRLTADERKIAPVIFRVLNGVRDRMGQHDIAEVEKWAIHQLNNYDELEVEYLEIVNTGTLSKPNSLPEPNSLIVCAAVNLGKVRLIDNLVIN
ncbi:MAG: pantoate--beta-alanine ligase [Bacteroidetes bacterium 4572_114]|nr:MAG: pantoate--beta-alanine ligase [Bacteroidetes bacterium 4572_114]